VYDEDDSRGVLKALIKEAGLDEKKYAPAMFRRVIDQAKNAYISPEQFAAQVSDFLGRMQADIYDRYQRALMKANAMDFGDLLMNAVLLLERHPHVRELYNEHLHFVLVDEFQDTNPVQYRFIRLITARRRNLLVVGDDDQSIYAFRGATIRNILDFEKDFPDAVVVTLDQNYRSTGNVLEAAHAVISRNKGRKPKKLWTAEAKGPRIATFVAMDEGDEARFVVQQIKQLRSSGTKLRDFAIFYRTNAQSRALEDALMTAAIPYRIYGGLRFYDRKEIRDILAYLRLVVNDNDDQAFQRVINTPPRGIGAQSVKILLDHSRDTGGSLMGAARASSNKSVSEFVTLMEGLRSLARAGSLGELIHETILRTEYSVRLEAMKDPQAQSRIENLQELASIGRSMEIVGEDSLSILRQFLDRVTLTSSAEVPVEDHKGDLVKKARGETVSLMTLHIAKGLEFPVVFFTGLEEGLVPHHRASMDPAEVEEERRLCYVGITRAMKVLYITRSMSRGMFSSGDGFGLGGSFREASRFMHDIPAPLFEHRGKNFLNGSIGDYETDPLDEEGAEKVAEVRPKYRVAEYPSIESVRASKLAKENIALGQANPLPARRNAVSAHITTADKLGAQQIRGTDLIRRRRSEKE